MKNIKPLNDRVLVQIIDESENKTGGLILVAKQEARAKQRKAKVLATGINVSQVKTGEIVIIPPYCGTQVGRADEEIELVIVKENEILIAFHEHKESHESI